MINTYQQQVIVKHAFTKFALFSLLIIVLSSCNGPQNGNAPPSEDRANGKGCTQIGVLLPDSAYSARWDSNDRPDLINDIRKYLPGARIDYANAEGDTAKQEQQANKAIANGDCILVIGAEDSVKASSIVDIASKHRIPVIAYDRLIQNKLINSYISFDNFMVGELQGQYIAAHYQNYLTNGHANVAMIDGAATDNNALSFRQGALRSLQQLFDSHKLTKVYDQYTPGWINDRAKAEMDQVLIDNHNDVQIAYAANDGLASGIIASLKAHGLNGKVLVTGQDATVIGIRNIIIGDQAMTVYKNVALEADATAHLVQLISKGIPVTTLTRKNATKTNDGGSIPSIIEIPVSVDKSNIAKTVLADGYVTKSDICHGLPAGVDTKGICS